MASAIKQEKLDAKTGNTSQSIQQNEPVDGSTLKRQSKSTTEEEPRRSKRQRVAPKTYDEEQTKSKSQRNGRGKTSVRWKEEELEKLLNCLKKYQRADNIYSVKKHVKTKNLEQVEAKLEHLKKKALERAMDESAGMPPLQCWEMLAKDVTNTLGDESYKELSKVFWTATTESKLSKGRNNRSAPNQPNYNEIYKFLAALLRGTPPPELSPIGK
ncbi:uncharacterized protein [Amphiura filiformis]|uniref:uncharacterized protein n=1 Tax=Amphiura filiformis TaxID=82378 RepID=UPI003B20C86B